MSDPRLLNEMTRYRAIKDRLLQDDPDLDDRTLADTVEGLTDLHEILIAVVRAALDDEAVVEGLKALIKQNLRRLERLENRAAKRRQIVKDAMLEASIQKLSAPDFLASVRQATPHVVVTDETEIPSVFWEMRAHLKKAELLKALKEGDKVSGAILSNPEMSLTVRTN